MYELERLRGIGPEIAKALAGLGIETLADLIETSAEDLDTALDGSSAAQIEHWQEEAALLHAKSNDSRSTDLSERESAESGEKLVRVYVVARPGRYYRRVQGHAVGGRLYGAYYDLRPEIAEILLAADPNALSLEPPGGNYET